MADPVDYKLSEIASASTLGDNDLMYLAHYDSQEQNYASQKTTVATLGAKIAEGVTYNDLQVPSGTAKQLVPAINYAISKTGWTDVTGTLSAGSTSITLSDASITTTSTIEVFTDPELEYNSLTVATGSVTLTFDAQSSSLGVKVRVS